MAARRNRKQNRKAQAQRWMLAVLLLGLLACVVIIGLCIGQKGPLPEPTDPSQTEPVLTSAPTESDPVTTEPSTEATTESTEATEEPTEAPTEATHTTAGTTAPTTAYTDPVEVPREELLVLVNSTHTVPEDWTVDLVYLRNNQAIDRRAYPSLQQMMDDCRAAGLDPVICSSYRTRETQERLYENRVKRWMNDNPDCTEEEAREGAAFWVAKPDTSEHQLGFAVDIVSNSNWNLDESQEKTATQKWLMENSWRYGWILRYPTDKSDITKIGYEPWHYRYVGVEAAREIYESGLCLEEYLGILD